MKYLVILFVMLSILFSMPIAFSEELYFDADFDFYGDDRFQKDRRYLLGDTVTIIGHSSYYDEPTDEHFPATDSTFHVIIKNPTQKIILDENYVSDDEGKMELFFILSDEYEIGEYKVEMIVNKQKHLDLSFYVGPTTEKSIYTNSTFDLWLEDSNPVVFSYVDLFGVMCSDAIIQSEKDSEFVFPFDGYIVKSSDVRFIANFTLPNGNNIQSSGEFNKNSCVPFSVGVPKTDFSGKWSVYVTAWWLNDDVLYHTKSSEISFEIRDPIFYDDSVEKIKLDSLSYYATPIDFHRDGNQVLLKLEQKNDLAILDLTDNSIAVLGLDLPVEKMEINSAKFSNDDFLYVQNHLDLWKYFPETKQAEKIMTGVNFYDVIRDGRIIYATLDEHEPYELYIANSDGVETQFLLKDNDLWEFDVNEEGTKLVHRKIIDSGYGWVETEIQIIDLQTGQKHSVPNLKTTCGSTPIWAPNNELILHMTTGCGRGWLGGTLYLSSEDGSYTETLVPSSNYRPLFLISPDGNYLLLTSFGEKFSDPDYLYKVTLAKSIPEFQTIATMVLVSSFLPVIILRNRFSLT
jgi:predicted secreted protein with PEFG-CTERM motif